MYQGQSRPTLRISFGDEVVEEADAKDGDKLTIDECHLLLEACGESCLAASRC
jgi:hypothetical protein